MSKPMDDMTNKDTDRNAPVRRYLDQIASYRDQWFTEDLNMSSRRDQIIIRQANGRYFITQATKHGGYEIFIPVSISGEHADTLTALDAYLFPDKSGARFVNKHGEITNRNEGV